MASTAKKLVPAKFVSEVVKDPKAPTGATLIFGYAGESSEAGNSRLYFDPQLSRYVDVPDESILHIQDAPAAVSPLGGSYVWIKSDAQVTYGEASARRPKVSFLAGTILGGPPTSPPCAGSTVAACQPQTEVPACPRTVLEGCQPVTVLPVCPPHTAVDCHPVTVPPACPHTSVGCPAPTTPAAGCPV